MEGIIFLSTPSGWRATRLGTAGSYGVEISIHALRVEGDLSIQYSGLSRSISIHALRVEGDERLQHPRTTSINFYPRPPGGGRLFTIRGAVFLKIFLSTPSGWRATFALLLHSKSAEISIHALRVEGDRSRGQSGQTPDISIHALRVEGDGAARPHHSNHKYFYPRPPGGGRPLHVLWIHSCVPYFYPRPPGGGRRKKRYFFLFALDFYPRPPGGGRLKLFVVFVSYSLFLSTPSGWRATGICSCYTSYAHYFYPRPPGGGRLSAK